MTEGQEEMLKRAKIIQEVLLKGDLELAPGAHAFRDGVLDAPPQPGQALRAVEGAALVTRTRRHFEVISELTLVAY